MYEPKFTGPPIKALKATAGGYKRRPWSLVGARLRSCLYASMACAAMLILQGCTGIPSSKWGSESRLAPVFNQNARYRIPDQYIISFKAGTDREAIAAAQRTVKRLGGTIRYTGTLAPLWFSATMPAEAVEAMRATPGVDYIEADQMGTASVTQCCPTNCPAYCTTNPADQTYCLQTCPPEGLDRTSERLLPTDDRFTYSETGTDVHVYVLDTGIETSHAQFSGRATSGPHANFVPTGTCSPDPGLTGDWHGHGTHVAGIIGGTDYGIAKRVKLHSVRILDCAKGAPLPNSPPFPASPTDRASAAVEWVISNKQLPAVANMSFNWFDPAPTFSTRVNNLIGAGVTVVISAGNDGVDATGQWPGNSVPGAIVVGAVNPKTDQRWGSSNFGSFVDLFAPGVDIVSVMPGSATYPIPGCTVVSTTVGSKTQRCAGTSMAAAHVSGVAALYLDSLNALPANPAAVKNRIVNYCHNGICVPNIVPTTINWAGVTEPGGGSSSPNKLLHWGSLEDGYTDGDPHIKTVNGVHYDFQGAGEYVSLRDQDGMEIQTRMAAIPTAFDPLPNPYTGLATCVSLNTAVAARVGKHRVTYQPNLSGVPDPSGLQLRVDGDLVELSSDGLELGSGGRIAKTISGGIEIQFPNETVLAVTPGWWASQSKWYLNVGVLRTRAKQGLMGAIRRGSWLPALPNGMSLGPMPDDLHQRYVELYQKLGDAWRVTDKTSLFDYTPGDSTKTFTMQSWPPESGRCNLADNEPVTPTTQERAEAACQEITDGQRRANCVFDVMVTGNPGFAETYRLSERIRAGSTTIALLGDQDTSQVGEWVTFTAIVAPSAAANRQRTLPGAVQFSLDGLPVGEPVKLDAKGRAMWETPRLKVGTHRVVASYMPGEESEFLRSTSSERIHTVRRCYCEKDKKFEKQEDR